MAKAGYIKFYRKSEDNDLYFAERFTRWQAWMDLLMLASYMKRTVFIRHVQVELEPGELCWSQLSLSKRWKWNRQTVSKFLNYLEKKEMISSRITFVTTVITITNWDIYNGLYTEDIQQSMQLLEQQSIQQLKQQHDSRTDTNNKVKNVDKDKNIIKNSENIEQVINNDKKKLNSIIDKVTNNMSFKSVTSGEKKVYNDLFKGSKIKGF